MHISMTLPMYLILDPTTKMDYTGLPFNWWPHTIAITIWSNYKPCGSWWSGECLCDPVCALCAYAPLSNIMFLGHCYVAFTDMSVTLLPYSPGRWYEFVY